jgi:hypothetical protein
MSEHSQTTFPLARSADLVTETLGSESVVYDGLSQEAHYLSPVAATVFAAADGQTSPADMAGIAGKMLGEPVDVTMIELALAELEERNLLVVEPSEDGNGHSRRDILRKSALIGGAALAAPLVTSVVTPAYGATASNPTNLSYVAMTFTCGTTAYRMKIGGDGSVQCGSTFNTPGDGDCTLDVPNGTTLSEDCLAGVSITQDITTDPNTVTIHFPATCKLRDYIVKCANNCQANNPAVPGSGADGPSFTVQGCPN